MVFGVVDDASAAVVEKSDGSGMMAVAQTGETRWGGGGQGAVVGVKFSLDSRIVAVQTSARRIDFVNLIDNAVRPAFFALILFRYAFFSHHSSLATRRFCVFMRFLTKKDHEDALVC